MATECDAGLSTGEKNYDPVARQGPLSRSWCSGTHEWALSLVAALKIRLDVEHEGEERNQRVGRIRYASRSRPEAYLCNRLAISV